MKRCRYQSGLSVQVCNCWRIIRMQEGPSSRLRAVRGRIALSGALFAWRAARFYVYRYRGTWQSFADCPFEFFGDVVRVLDCAVSADDYVHLDVPLITCLARAQRMVVLDIIPAVEDVTNGSFLFRG